jgi:superfamily II DNA or RNA helicase
VELARAGAVIGESDDGTEIVLRVSTKGGLVCPQVVLFPEDEDWTCECNAPGDACAHVAASIIALSQARREGQKLPGGGAQAPGHIAYRLDGRSGKLTLFRVIVQDGREHPLEGSLAHIALGKVKGPKFVTSEADLGFEKKLGSFSGGSIPRPLMVKVLEALQGAGELTLDGLPAQVVPPTSGLAVRVTENAGGFLARLVQDPDIDALYENGAIRRSNTVCAVGEHGLSEMEFADLRKGRAFSPEDVGTLVGDLLPRLRRTLNVVLETGSLPGARTSKPRIQVATLREGDALVVLPTIVYGDPPRARVDGERLTMLREGEVPLRNARLEKLLAGRMRDLGLDAGVKHTMPAGAAIELAARLRDEADLRVTGDAHHEFFAAGDLSPRLSVDENGAYEVWFESAEGGGGKRESRSGRIEAAAVVRAWEQGLAFAPLLDGGFGRIPAEWLANHGHRVAGLLAATESKRAEGSDGKVAAWAWADVAALCEALEQPSPPEFERLRTLVEDFAGIPEPVLPGDLNAELRDYQKRGVAWLSFLRQAELGALLADDMGLGKTLQALCAIQGRTLVVAPTSVLHNWSAEIAKFRPSLRVGTYHGPNRALDPDVDVTLTTYALLRLDIDELSRTQWDVVVLDESQAIKNPDSQVARAAYRLQATFRVALTGTPVENRLDDLWSQFHFLNRGLLGGHSEFADRYARPIAIGEEGAAKVLRERIRPFLLRRLKGEVARELPPRTDVVLRCELETEERQLYDAVRAATQETIVEKLGGGGNVMAMLEALLRLRQAACHRGLVPGQAQATPEASSKIKLLLETLDEVVAEGHKALVFSQWTSLLDLVEPHLRAAALNFVRLDGSTRDRGAVVEAFQDEAGPPVMLISLRAGGTGLNLTAADHVFLLDPWWNPAVEDQAADRAHRIGQDRPVIVHRLVARDTVEERILTLQERKRELAQAAVGDATGAAQITREELLALLD